MLYNIALRDKIRREKIFKKKKKKKNIFSFIVYSPATKYACF